MLKIALVLMKNVFFGLKKGISELLHWVAPKHTAVFLTFCDYSLPFSDEIKLLYILAFLLPVRSL